MNRLIICGSPRTQGRSASLADQLFDACIEECPDDEVSLASVASLAVSPCEGCNRCRDTEENQCVLGDDMGQLRELLDGADELVIVSPVYFAGPPAQFKALLDRLQPYYWRYTLEAEDTGAFPLSQHKRPATLHVIGEGGDPHGFAPLVGSVRSALACVGFELTTLFDWVGKIDERGVILADAEKRPVDKVCKGLSHA